MRNLRQPPPAAEPWTRDSDEVEVGVQTPPTPLHTLQRLQYRNSNRKLSYTAKRAIDVAVATAALIVFAPVMAVVSAAILVDTGRPVFFSAPRLGRDGRIFNMLKFRTMVQDAQDRLPELQHLNLADGMVKIPNDPRVTRVGRWLRRFSLDELPQFWNVLRGDMSLVGPRPHEPQEVSLDEVIHQIRLLMRPGLTGLWQITARDHPSLAVRVHYDLRYLSQWSLWLDLKIALLTIAVVLQGTGGRVRIDARDMPEIRSLPELQTMPRRALAEESED